MKDNKKVLLMIMGILIFVLMCVVLIFMIFFRGEKKFVVKHGTVDNLYNDIETTSCSYNDEVNLNDNSILYLVFTKLKKDNILADSFSVKEYNNAGKKLLGEDDVLPKSFVNYDFDGYSYTLNGDNIERTKGTCGDKKYISKLFGYTYNEKELIVNVKIAYIKNNKMYDLTDKELGEYKKDTQNTLIDSSSSKIYTYNKNGNNYYLKNISNEE